MPAKTKRREPPRRTRRVALPFDDRLEVRCYKAEKSHLAEEAKQRGMTVGDLVRSQLGDLLGPTPTPPPPAPKPENVSYDLSEAIATAHGITPGKAIMTIRLGRVAVHGEPWFHEEIPGDLLPHVTVQGEPLPVQAPDGDHG